MDPCKRLERLATTAAGTTPEHHVNTTTPEPTPEKRREFIAEMEAQVERLTAEITQAEAILASPHPHPGDYVLMLEDGGMVVGADPADDQQLSYLRAAMMVVDRKARLLGLDAPVNIQLGLPSKDELDQWVAAVAERGTAARRQRLRRLLVTGVAA